MPVSQSDHGSNDEGQNASAVGRICTMTALKPKRLAWSSRRTYCACCPATGSPGFEGQSMLRTVATHIARSWRLGAAGSARRQACACAGAGAGAAASRAATTRAAIGKARRARTAGARYRVCQKSTPPPDADGAAPARLLVLLALLLALELLVHLLFDRRVLHLVGVA